MSITPQLQDKVDFIPYFQGGESLLVAQGNPLHIQSTSDLCGLAVGVKAATFEQHDLQDASDMCKEHGKALITAVVVQKNADAVQLLATKRVVATYQDAPMTDFYVKQNPKLFQKAGAVVDATIEGIAVRKGDTTMFNGIKKALTELEADGTYHTLINKWGLMSGDIMAVHS
jgi:ABC-type amino acid transport substrate-binding protein